MTGPQSADTEARTEARNAIFVGDGEMARLMRSHDWAATSLGDPLAWPEGLKVAVRILLTSKFDMWLGWGPDIAFLYNDAYRPTLGQKHPRSLGMPTKELWAEIWHDVEPRLRQVYDEGKATWDSALLLLLNRAGYVEETYHTFSYSPLLDDHGGVGGVFCAVTEDTERVLGERRLGSLRALASGLAGADSPTAVLAAAEQATKLADKDMPFCLCYRFAADGSSALAFGQLGPATDGRTPDERTGDERTRDERIWHEVWQLDRLRSAGAGEPVDLPEGHDLPRGPWQQPARQAIVIPIAGQGSDALLGALVIGLNPHRAFDGSYRSYLELFAGQLSAGLVSANVFESERRRARMLDEALQMRKDAAEALRLANERLTSEVRDRTEERDTLQSLFKQAPSFMALLSGPDHRFTQINDAYLQLVGHRNLLGLPLREALPEVEGQGYFEVLDRVYETGEPFVGRTLPVKLQRQAGGPLEERFVHLVYQPVAGADGRTAAIFVEGYDVTHQKQAEDALHRLNGTLEHRVSLRTQELVDALAKLERETSERRQIEDALKKVQKMEALGALTGGVAHDFNNLLQVISGNLQLLSRSVADNPKATERVQSALAGVRRGAKLASQLLAFGRRQPLEPKVVNVGKFIRGMEDMLSRAIGEGIEIEVVISGGLWNTLVDPGQIENAVLNLAINARDAMEGHGHLTIEAGNALLDEAYCLKHQDVVPGQYVMVAVTDTGCGMAPEVLERAFEPFYSTKPEGKGSGLGLSMVYGLVKQSGGHVMIYSEIGQGTTVKLYLPRELAQEDVMATPASGPVRGGTETVLVVEDDDAVREIAVATLVDLGYRVLKAKDADSALSVIDSGAPIDLLFTDVVMPGTLRSPEMARLAQQRLPDLAVIFTSGYTENSIVHGGRLDPGVELLSKPYTTEALARRIRHVLGNRAQRRQAAANTPRRAATTPAGAGLKLLVVEDDELIRSTTAGALRAEGYAVRESGSAADALSQLADAAADVLVIDVGLPDISGVEAARMARARQPGLAIVFASGAFIEAGQLLVPGSQVVVKPYDVDQLIGAIGAALAETSR